MPKIKKYRELSRRQQNRRLLLAEQNRFISSMRQKFTNTKIHAEVRLERDNFDIIQISDQLSDADVQISDINNKQLLSNEEINIQNTPLVQDVSSSRFNAEDQKYTLQQRLRFWATNYNITHKSLTALLNILRKEGHKELPIDARTLLHTPSSTVIRDCAGGQYFHYGLEKSLREILELYGNISNPIEINLNIDGLPLSKSSLSQLWPVLGQIYNNTFSEPFLIGAFHGYKKPTNAQLFLQEFCEEYNMLYNEGFLWKNEKYFVKIRTVICDAPAKSFVTGTKGHNAYFGCAKCFCEGDYVNHKMVYLEEDAILRSDNNFRTRQNEEHHLSVSPFENLHIDMIKNFPLDYMHLICLGVMKKMLFLWIKGKSIPRLRTRDVEALSADITKLKEFIPLEFARRPRNLNEINRWKATEFRSFLLYFGPIILQKYLPENYLKHFCVLHTAIRILCHPKHCLYNNTCAKELLLYFVKTFKILYGKENLVYNIHNLIHISLDVKTYGSLDTFSAFAFENYMQMLKKMLRKSEKPLSQLNNRITEKRRAGINTSIFPIHAPFLLHPDKKNLPLDCVNSHKKIIFNNFIITTKLADNCCFLRNGSIFCVEYIGYKNNMPIAVGRKYLDLRPVSMYPCNSQDLDIYIIDQLSNLEIISITEIEKKAFTIINYGVHYAMPLLH